MNEAERASLIKPFEQAVSVFRTSDEAADRIAFEKSLEDLVLNAGHDAQAQWSIALGFTAINMMNNHSYARAMLLNVGIWARRARNECDASSAKGERFAALEEFSAVSWFKSLIADKSLSADQKLHEVDGLSHKNAPPAFEKIKGPLWRFDRQALIYC